MTLPADPATPRRVGPHLPLGAGLLKAAERAREVGAGAVQIFSDNPTAWRRKPEPPADVAAFRERLRELDIGPLAVHGPYLINLCGPDQELWDRSVATVVAELHMGAAYGASFVNIHIGSHKQSGFEAGLDRLARGLAAALEQVPPAPGVPLLVLENSAGGAGMGGTMEELAGILELAQGAGVPLDRLGFCLDTAHLWAAGHEISRPEVLDRLLDRFDALIGPERLAMMHLNDAGTALASTVDRHEHIGAGAIGPIGMAHVLRHPRLRSVPAYLETPGMDMGYDGINMERVRRLQDDQTLPDLPADAFTVRGSRSRSASPGASPRPEA
ncbi:deoxyribonuclease IV [soil metagenome]